MEFTYEKVNNELKTVRRTIEVTPTLDDYVEFIASQVDNEVWSKETYGKVKATIKWLFDNGHLTDETFDDSDDFRDYLYDSYRDSVEWEYEIDDEDREY